MQEAARHPGGRQPQQAAAGVERPIENRATLSFATTSLVETVAVAIITAQTPRKKARQNARQTVCWKGLVLFAGEAVRKAVRMRRR